ncbi:Ras-related protein RABH1c [Tritrichomonas foetus]|uniref:Ras-related protein RABH1c n=1 Tax=Tritrichomonas foetus TaxID=1144522 RepID=A0A1J4JQ72_9EUKA|nr:Ras-related protein RABH1c [Tritrichomonas foetus]|eukprot:OHS99667.1 Ras-related protein RABH1c [Tritrichomonas foetus]
MSNGQKAVFLGPTNVGKTSIMAIIDEKQFPDLTTPTITTSVVSKKYYKDLFEFTINYWDTAGQERFKSLARSHIRGASLAIAVFDITKNETFTEMQTYIDLFQRECPQFSENIIVVGNKADLLDNIDDNSVSEQYSSWCKENNINFLMTSAKTQVGINELESLVSEILYESLEAKEIKVEPEYVELTKPINNEEKKGCC